MVGVSNKWDLSINRSFSKLKYSKGELFSLGLISGQHNNQPLVFRCGIRHGYGREKLPLPVESIVVGKAILG